MSGDHTDELPDDYLDIWQQGIEESIADLRWAMDILHRRIEACMEAIHAFPGICREDA